ncbi:MAG: diphosphomevalonate decarboxylase [Rhodothermales bacterium]|jgi:diphosphomevalonate decarboxylase
MDRVAEIVQQILPSPGPVAEFAEGRAPVNIAMIKYWGKRDAVLNLPMTGSLSVAIPELGTHTMLAPAEADSISIAGEPQAAESAFAQRISRFLDPFRRPGVPGFRVETTNSVPTAAGLASSASGFAALTLALDSLFSWRLRSTQLSVLARVGSGSACRSVFPRGFVEWTRGEREDGLDSHAHRIADAWPGLCIGVITVSAGEKPISSREAMNRTVATSRLYREWPARVAADLANCKAGIAARDFHRFGQVAEDNALAMHATMRDAEPPVDYALPDTHATIASVHALRAAGCPVYLTMDAGPNVKLIYPESAESAIRAELPGLGTHRVFPA